MKVNLSKVAKRFFSSSDVVQSFSRGKLSSKEKKLFKKYLINKGKVLDICCGAGRVSIPLSKRGFKVVGIDNSKEMIEAAKRIARKKKVKNIVFLCDDASKINFEKESFDYVLIMENSLESIFFKNKIEKIIKKCYSFLKKDHILIASFNSCFYPKIFFKFFTKKIINSLLSLARISSKNDPHNIFLRIKEFNKSITFYVFTPFEVRRMLKKAGFDSFEILSFNELGHKSRFKNIKIYRYLRPFLYCYWIAKKE